MKRCYIRTVCMVLAVAGVMGGCKKGENDPFFSFRSRKARLSGDWTVESATLVTRDSTLAFDGTTATLSANNDTTGASKSFGLGWTMSFDSEGTYELVQVSDFPEGYFGEDTPGYTLTETEKGEWEFTGGNNGTKNKEELLLLPAELSTVRSDQGSNISVIALTNPIEGRVYNIDRLAVDELVLKHTVTHSSAFEQYTESAEIELKQ